MSWVVADKRKKGTVSQLPVHRTWGAWEENIIFYFLFFFPLFFSLSLGLLKWTLIGQFLPPRLSVMPGDRLEKISQAFI